MALTPNDVLNKQFQTTKFRDGYDQDEVDDFLDEVLAEFQRLIAENDALKSQLAAAPAAAPLPAPVADTGALDAANAQLAALQSQIQELQAQLQQAQTEAEQARQQAQQAGVDGMGSAEYLQLARRVHEEHVREGVAKRDQLVAAGTAQAATLVSDATNQATSLVADAQSKADSLLGEAQTNATAIVSQAQAHADSLVSQAQQAYDDKVSQLAGEVSQLEQSKSVLEQNVAELQEFERHYRTSLKSHLESHLADLEGVATGVVPTASPAPTPTEGAAPLVDPESAAAWLGAETPATPVAAQEAEPEASAPTEIPDFGTQRVDGAVPGLPEFGQATTGEQPAPGAGGD